MADDRGTKLEDSNRAIKVNILIMRAFVRLRVLISSHKELFRKLEDMEKKYDEQFRVVFEAIRQLMTPPEPTKKKIGFVNEPAARYEKGKTGGCQSKFVTETHKIWASPS